MSKFITFKPIGEILTEADLITKPQLEVALRDQIYNENMLLGEILALRGWIKQDTADFFVREWFNLVNRRTNRPIGFYLNRAGLLSSEDIQKILAEQRRLSLRFGDTAVQKGLLKPSTIDFFLKYLYPSQLHRSFPENSEDLKESNDKDNKIITKEDITYWVTLSSQKVSY